MNLKKNNSLAQNKEHSRVKERNYWLDNTKFLLILLVVVGHFVGLITEKYKSMEYLYLFIYMFHMPLFIFITGFFSKNVIKKGKNKILNFLLLYVIMQAVETLISRSKVTIINPRYGLWYLETIIVYNLLLPFIHKIKPKIACVTAIIIGLLAGFDSNIGTTASLSRIFVMLPFFIMGYFTDEKMLGKLKNKKFKIFAVIFLIVLVAIIPILANEPIKMSNDLLFGKFSYKKMNLGWTGIFYRAAWYILAIVTSMSILAIVPDKKINVLSKFGSRTLQAYCLHIIVYLFFKKTNIYQSINTQWICVYMIAGATILTMILSLKIFSYPFEYIMKRKFEFIYNKKEKQD